LLPAGVSRPNPIQAAGASRPLSLAYRNKARSGRRTLEHLQPRVATAWWVPSEGSSGRHRYQRGWCARLAPGRGCGGPEAEAARWPACRATEAASDSAEVKMMELLSRQKPLAPVFLRWIIRMIPINGRSTRRRSPPAPYPQSTAPAAVRFQERPLMPAPTFPGLERPRQGVCLESAPPLPMASWPCAERGAGGARQPDARLQNLSNQSLPLDLEQETGSRAATKTRCHERFHSLRARKQEQRATIRVGGRGPVNPMSRTFLETAPAAAAGSPLRFPDPGNTRRPCESKQP